MLETKLERCDPFDPERCQASGQMGQCPFRARKGEKNCPRHASNVDKRNAVAAANQYRLQVYQGRMTEFTTNSEIKNLRAEIGILRMTLENIIDQCHSPAEMAVYAGKIGDIVIKIRTLVKTCQDMDKQMGMMLDRDKIMLIGQKIVDIIEKVIPNKEILNQVGEDIVQAILEVSIE